MKLFSNRAAAQPSVASDRSLEAQQGYSVRSLSAFSLVEAVEIDKANKLRLAANGESFVVCNVRRLGKAVAGGWSAQVMYIGNLSNPGLSPMSLAALPISVQELDAVPDQQTAASTRSILQRIAAGDTSAVSDCLDQYSGLVWSLAAKSCPSRDDAEDVVQEIFVELWQKAATFDPDKASETTFVAMIARRRLIDGTRRRASAVEIVNIDSEQAATPDYLPDESAELADEAAKAAACLKRLPETQQRVISMSIHGGQPYSRIASLLSIPLGTVKSYARRSLLQLRKCMARPATDGGVS